MSIEEFTKTVNEWGNRKIPFLFLVDFEMERPLVFPLKDIRKNEILYNINGVANYSAMPIAKRSIDFEKIPLEYKDYKIKYDQVLSHLAYGDTYLTNLTIKTKVHTPLSLKEIFFLSDAKYKLLFGEEFLVFSPETFIRISAGRIFAYPMKGTIDASVPHAKERVLADRKEMAEHVTIVDLLRNDLSAVAENVQVARFRYVEEIRTTNKDLLQVSSEITGDLPADYRQHLGDILLKLLPAGSVSGAPKTKTLEIIREAEQESRGYYTGVVGLFDGNTLDSGVMIRFMERHDDHFYYRSGGGITMQSQPETEYQEAIDKVYVPVH